MDTEEDRMSYDSDEERQRKREEEKESRRIAKLRAAMLVVAADDWLKEDHHGQIDEELIGMMGRPDDIEPRDWEDAKVILAELKKYDYSDYWTSRLLPQEDDQEIDAPQPDVSNLGQSSVFNSNAEELGQAYTREYGASSAANDIDITSDITYKAIKPFKSCLRDPKLSCRGKGIRNVSFGIIKVEVYSVTEEEIDFKKVDCGNDFVECNGRRIRDISSNEFRMEELDNLDLFLARKLKYKQVEDIQIEEEDNRIKVETKKEEKKKASIPRKPVIVTCDMIKKEFQNEMVKSKIKQGVHKKPTSKLLSSDQPLAISSDIKAFGSKLSPTKPCSSNTVSSASSDIVVPYICAIEPEKLPSGYKGQGTNELPIDKIRRRLRRVNNTIDLPSQSREKSKVEGIPVVKEAFGATFEGNTKTRRSRSKPLKATSQTTAMEFANVNVTGQTHSVSESKINSTEPRRPDNCAEERNRRKITPRAPRETPRSADKDTAPNLTRPEEPTSDKPEKQHKIYKRTRSKKSQNDHNGTDVNEQKAADDGFEHFETTGSKIINVKPKAEDGSVEWDNTLEDEHGPLKNDPIEIKEEKRGVGENVSKDRSLTERVDNDRVNLEKKDQTERRKEVKKCQREARCRIIEVRPVDDVNNQWDNTLTPETNSAISLPKTTSDPQPIKEFRNFGRQSKNNPAPNGSPSIQPTVASTDTALRTPPKGKRLRNQCQRFRHRLSNTGHRLRSLSYFEN